MSKKYNAPDPDELLNKLRLYADGADSEKRSDAYSRSNNPGKNDELTLEELMERLKEKGFIEKIGTEKEEKPNIKTAYSLDEEGEFSEKEFFSHNDGDAQSDKKENSAESESITVLNESKSDESSLSGDENGEVDDEYSLLDIYGLDEKTDEDDSLIKEADGVSDAETDFEYADTVFNTENEDTDFEKQKENADELPIEKGKEEIDCTNSDIEKSSIIPTEQKKESETEKTAQEEKDKEESLQRGPSEENEVVDEVQRLFGFNKERKSASEIQSILGEYCAENEIINKKQAAHTDPGEKFENSSAETKTLESTGEVYDDEFIFEETDSYVPKSLRQNEYTSYSITKKRKDYLRKKLKAEVYSLLALIAIAPTAMIFENFLISDKGPLYPGGYNYVWLFISLLFIIGTVIIGRNEFTDGLFAMVSGRIIPQSAFTLLILPILIMYITSVITGRLCVLLAFPFTLCALFCKLSSVLLYSRMIDTFSVVSNECEKSAVCKTSFNQMGPEKRVMSEFVTSENYYCKKSAKFTDNFVKHSFEHSKKGIPVSVYLLLSIIFSLIMFIVAFKNDMSNLSYAVQSLVCTVFICMPFGVFILSNMITYAVSLKGASDNVAILGEKALDTFEGGGVFSICDRDLFNENNIRITGMKVFGDFDFTTAITYTSAVFDELDTPLGKLLANGVKGGKVPIARIDAIFDDGIQGEVEGKKVLIGSADFIKSIGFVNIPEVFIDRKKSQMFTAIDGKLASMYDILYGVRSSIASAVEKFSGSGIYITLRTLDPNITTAFVTERLGGNVPIRVIKSSIDISTQKIRKNVDTRIVTTGKLKPLISAINLCDRGNYTKKMGTVMTIASALTGAVFFALSLILDIDFSYKTGLYISLYQIIWQLPITLMSVFYIK